MIKMIIFDLDGTLLNTLEDLADAGNYALAESGFPVYETEKYKYFIGNGIPKLIERITPETADAELYSTMMNKFCLYYKEHMNYKTKPYDGALKLLESLKEKGILSIVVTNKSHEFAEVIVKKYFGNLINRTFGSVEGYPKKPDPYWAKKALSEFNIKENEALYVGDSGVDMQTANKAGLISIGVTWGFRTEDELINNGAVHICNSFNEIYKIISDNIY